MIATPSVGIVIPTRNNPVTLPQVLAEIPAALHPTTFVVDDGSSPPVMAEGVQVLRHEQTRGYGAAQKTGYTAAIEAGIERVVLLHGDGQYPTASVLALAEMLGFADAALGSRFLGGGGDYVPWWRRLGIRFLTTAANMRWDQTFSDLHTGARAYRTEFLQQLPFDSFSDDYLFDHQLLTALISSGRSIAERSVSSHYDDTVQSINATDAIRYGLGCLGHLIRPPS